MLAVFGEVNLELNASIELWDNLRMDKTQSSTTDQWKQRESNKIFYDVKRFSLLTLLCKEILCGIKHWQQYIHPTIVQKVERWLCIIVYLASVSSNNKQ